MHPLRQSILFLCLILGAAGLWAQDKSPAGPPLGRGRIEPEFVRVQPGAPQQFRAIIEAPKFDFSRVADKVTWTVNEIVGGDAQVGTIDATGLYRAPAQVPAPHEVHVRAEVQGIANRYLFATALVGAPEISYTMSRLLDRSSRSPSPEDPAQHRLRPSGQSADCRF